MLARKPGKLPHDTIRAEYALEYGTDALELHSDAVADGARVVVISHLGRPEGQSVDEFSLRPVAERLGELLDADIEALMTKPSALDDFKLPVLK